MQGRIQTGVLICLIHSYGSNLVDDYKHHPGKAEGINTGAKRSRYLLEKEAGVALHNPSATGGIDRFCSKYTQQYGAKYAPDSVNSPDIQRIIPTHSVLKMHDEVTDISALSRLPIMP